MSDKCTGSSNEVICPPQKSNVNREWLTAKERDERTDAVKYWLIFLVIAGHVFSGKEFADSTASIVLEKWIYIFHMPLFIFISGYFSRKKSKKDFWPSIWKLLEPLIIFHLLGLIFYVDSLSIKSILTPWWVLWYLFSLICWRLMIQIIPEKILCHSIIVVVCTFCISILAGFFPFGRILSMQRTLSFMPFFFLGYCMRDKKLYLPDKFKPFFILFLVAMFALPIFFPEYLGNLRHSTPYNNSFEAVNRMIVYILAVPFSIAFINVCCKVPWAASQGRLSMQYFIYHAFIIPPIMAIVSKLNIPMSFFSAAIITIGITIGIGAILRIPGINLLTNPSMFFINK